MAILPQRLAICALVAVHASHAETFNYTWSQGSCSGGKVWCSGSEWDCVGNSLTDDECARLCEQRGGCSAYERHDEVRGECCLYKGSVRGNGQGRRRNRVCMIKQPLQSALRPASMVHSWWHRTAAFQTIAIEGKTRAELYDYLDTLEKYGTKVLGLNVCYFNGPAAMWGGLAMNDPFRVHRVFGSEVEFDKFVSVAHNKGMKVISWMNPSYWWTGSKYVKQAEREMKVIKVKNGDWKTDLPADSPARWFQWSTIRSPKQKPADDDAEASYPGEVLNWVWDPDAGYSYRSHWADQPMIDFNSPAFQKAWVQILDYWISQRHLDGFVYDAPDRYLGTEMGALEQQFYEEQGIPTGQFKKVITDPARTLTQEFGQFAEAYGEQQLMVDFGLSGVLQSHWDNRFEAWGDIVDGIKDRSRSRIDSAFRDYDKLLCTNEENNYNGILWQRHHNLPFGNAGVRKNALARSIAVVGGYLAAVEDPGEPYEWWKEGQWWAAEPYTGTEAVLQDLARAIETCHAFAHGTIRERLPVRTTTDGKKFYGVLRWVQGGPAGFAIFNLEDSEATAVVEVPAQLRGEVASDCATGESYQALSDTLTVRLSANGIKIIGVGQLGQPMAAARGRSLTMI